MYGYIFIFYYSFHIRRYTDLSLVYLIHIFIRIYDSPIDEENISSLFSLQMKNKLRKDITNRKYRPYVTNFLTSLPFNIFPLLMHIILLLLFILVICSLVLV